MRVLAAVFCLLLLTLVGVYPSLCLSVSCRIHTLSLSRFRNSSLRLPLSFSLATSQSTRHRHTGTPITVRDVGGAADVQVLWDRYFGVSHAIIFVVDASAGERLDEAVACFHRALTSAMLAGKPVLVAFNAHGEERRKDDGDDVAEDLAKLCALFGVAPLEAADLSIQGAAAPPPGQRVLRGMRVDAMRNENVANMFLWLGYHCRRSIAASREPLG